MKLSKAQREQHRGAAQELITQLERRLCTPQAGNRNLYRREPQRQHIAECVGAYKAKLEANPRDPELLRINLELAELFYRTCNASKRGRAPQ